MTGRTPFVPQMALGAEPHSAMHKGDIADGVVYVSVNGNDSNGGTERYTAKATIAAAVAALPSGGTIILQGGTHTVTAPTALASNIRLIGEGNPTISAAGTEAVWDTNRGILELHYGGSGQLANVAIEGITFAAAGSALSIVSFGSTGLRIRRCRFTGAAAVDYGTVGLSAGYPLGGAGAVTDTEISGCQFVNTGNTGVRLYSDNGRFVERTRIENNEFVGNRVRYTGAGAITLDALDVMRDTVIVGNTFRDIVGGLPDSGSDGYANAVGGGQGAPYVVFDTTIVGNVYRNTLPNMRQGFVHIYQATRTVIADNIAVGNYSGGQVGPAIAPGRLTNPSIGLTITGNQIENFEGFWDPDAMSFVVVANNVIRNCGYGLVVGYSVQEYIDIHDNVFYNSGGIDYGGAIQFSNADSLKVQVHDNLIVDDRATPVITRFIQLTGNDQSDAQVYRNRVYVPHSSGALTNLHKELGTEVAPRVIVDNEIHDSTGVRHYDPHVLSYGATPNGAVGPQSGTGATATATGDDTAGRISLTTGTGATGGVQVSVQFAASYAATPKGVVITPANANAGGSGAGFYVDAAATNTTGFTISSATAPAASTVFLWDYVVIQ